MTTQQRLTAFQAFFRYFYEQNDVIERGATKGVKLNLKSLGIGNGIIDAALQFPAVRTSLSSQRAPVD